MVGHRQKFVNGKAELSHWPQSLGLNPAQTPKAGFPVFTFYFRTLELMLTAVLIRKHNMDMTRNDRLSSMGL